MNFKSMRHNINRIINYYNTDIIIIQILCYNSNVISNVISNKSIYRGIIFQF